MTEGATRLRRASAQGLPGAARRHSPFLLWALAAGLATPATSALSQATQLDFEAQLGIPRPAGAAPQVIAGGLGWQCGGRRCTARGRGTGKPTDLCRSLAEQVGVLNSFQARGAWSLTALELEQCNRGLAPAAKNIPGPAKAPGSVGAASAAGERTATQLPDPKAPAFMQEWAVSRDNARGTTTVTHGGFTGKVAAL